MSAVAVALDRFPQGGAAIVLGAGGAIGGAMARALGASERFGTVLAISRHSDPALDLRDEDSIARLAAAVAALPAPPRLIFDATGVLHGPLLRPEKAWRELDARSLAEAFHINAIGPALLMKHLLPLLPREGRAVFATLSARVGSIGDNRLGGWYGYRASKAALNQFVRTAAVELARTRPEAICVALHPGTVASDLSAPFSKNGLDVRSSDVAAADLLLVLNALGPRDSGGFFDYAGDAVPW